MSEFSALASDVLGHCFYEHEFNALIDFCRESAPDALPYFEKMIAARKAIIDERDRLDDLIWALHKEASNDGYHGQVQDAIKELKAQE